MKMTEQTAGRIGSLAKIVKGTQEEAVALVLLLGTEENAQEFFTWLEKKAEAPEFQACLEKAVEIRMENGPDPEDD